MRQRKANQTALTKTLEFLTEVKRIANSGEKKTLSELYKQFNVSKATGAACKKLDLFYYHETGAIVWMGGEVKKEQALSILEVLRLRNDKMVAIPLEGFESLVDTLQQLVISLKPKTENRMTVGHYEKQIADKKHDDFLKIVCAMAGSSYSENMLTNENFELYSDILSRRIIISAKQLLDRVYEK